jgi:nicotinate dehydrogenase subunit A
MMATIDLRINGKQQTIQADPATPLLYVLRNQLALNGPKFGCGMQQCGACMVLLDGKAAMSCTLPVAAVKDRAIVTLEGLSGTNNTLHPVQTAFIDQQAAQCGYCLNGMVMSAVSLLKENPHPDDAAIRTGMQRVLCRCGSQARIIRAVKQAAASR